MSVMYLEKDVCTFANFERSYIAIYMYVYVSIYVLYIYNLYRYIYIYSDCKLFPGRE